MEINEANADQQVDLAIGELLQLRLEENPTTGFRWAIVSGGEPACALGNDAFEPGSGMHGTAGQHVWQLRAVQEGTGVVELHYRRPWDTESRPGRVFRATVRVSAA